MYRTVLWTLWERERVGDLGEWHWNMCNIMYETSCQSRFNARYWMLGAGALGWPRGMVWGGRREEGGGFRMGSTCIPVADLFWCLAKLIQCFRVKNKIKTNKQTKKNKKTPKALDNCSWFWSCYQEDWILRILYESQPRLSANYHSVTPDKISALHFCVNSMMFTELC